MGAARPRIERARKAKNATARLRWRYPQRYEPDSTAGGAGNSPTRNKYLTPWTSSTIVRAMNGQNLSGGICREIIR
jgi:hypothetical protein